ncbi:MAG: hypothetical protein GY853_01900 [PVC group bacterium]|nr:hypothetical protein [PVC group bacterium]
MRGKFLAHIATAAITDPAEVEAQCSAYGFEYDKGAIFCNIPELGWEGDNYVYCRYGLSFPYLRIQDGWKLLIEPTIVENDGEKKRWFYTGIADCGGDDGVTPDTDMQMLLKFVSQVIYASGTELHLGSQDCDEPLVKGNTLKEWCESVDDALDAIIQWGGTGVAPGPGGGISPLSGATASEFDDEALSEEVFTE